MVLGIMSQTKENSMRLQKVEKDVALIQQDINYIKTNHLHHIQESMYKLDKRMWWILAILVSTMASAIGAIFLNLN